MEGFKLIDHKFGYFLDPEKYVPILNQDDESFAILKLSLILDNFLHVFIENTRKNKTEKYVKAERYFQQKLETSVALGFPVSIAESFSYFNGLRNQLSHKIDYIATNKEIDVYIEKVESIKIEECNINNYFNTKIEPYFNEGVNGFQFVKESPNTLPDNKLRIIRMTAATFLLANKSAFYTISKLHETGVLSLR